MFGISLTDVQDKTKVKILNGIAGSGKSTTAVNTLRQLSETFILASFSNALKFSASDKFKCPTDTICGLCFVNTPFPRSDEKPVVDYDTVILDEILLDGVETINWIKHNKGMVNIIALTDSRQMLQAENSRQVLKAFDSLIHDHDVITVDITETKRAVNDFTRYIYTDLYNTNSDKLFTVQSASELLHADIITIDEIEFNESSTYICHSNIIEHEIYKRYDISNRRDIPLIPKNHIARNRKFDPSKYPICDQITATDRSLNSYLQAANIATPTRFQGKEVLPNNSCYFIVSPDSVFTGRELYTVGTRCKDIASLKIVLLDTVTYDDPSSIYGKPIAYPKHLNVPKLNRPYQCVTQPAMAKLIKQYGEPTEYYYTDVIASDNNIIFSTLSNSQLSKFAKIEGDKVTFSERNIKTSRSLRSVTKRDTTMHFDFMPKVYDILKTDITPPRINNDHNTTKKKFDHLADIYSAFPTVLHYAPMPKAGYLYETYDPDLLNFYRYKGDKVTKGSIITEELATLLGESDYVFSTAKQTGCELGHYTYEKCFKSKEDKDNINKNFLWGILESDYYKKEMVSKDGETLYAYVKHEKNNLELVACALWSHLCLIMLNAISSINAKEFFVVTDGLYYNGDTMPTFPSYCDYRIELKDWTKTESTDEKYTNIIFKTYKDLSKDKTNRQKAYREKQKAKLMQARNSTEDVH